MTDPTTVLAQQADQVRVLVDGVMIGYPGRATVTVDDGEDACFLPHEDRWPLRWSYVRRTYYEDADPLAMAEEIAARLVAEGWRRRVDPAGSGQARIVVQNQGTAVTVGAQVASDVRVLQISAGSPCVNADGSLDRRYLP